MTARSKVIAGLVLLVVIGAIVALILAREYAPAEEITVAEVVQEDLKVAVSVTGEIELAKRQDVFPASAGIIDEVFVKDGQQVTAGTILATLDREPLELQLAQAEAGLAQARSQIAAIDRQEPTKAELEAANAAVAAARSLYQSARQAYDAAKAAYLISPSPSLEASVTQAETAMLQAHAGLLQARAQQQRLEGTELSRERAAANSALNQARDAVALARENLERAALTAPIDGVVLFNPAGTPAADGEAPRIAAGSPVGPQAAPFTLLNLESAYFRAGVDEADIAGIKPGMSATVNLDAFPGEGMQGSVTRISPVAVMTATGGTTYPVYIEFDNAAPPLDLLVGMKGDAEIAVDAVEEALTIPVEALFDEDGAYFVYLVDPNMVLARTLVEVGTLTEVKAQLVSGVSKGDEVALSGPVELTDGLRVRVER